MAALCASEAAKGTFFFKRATNPDAPNVGFSPGPIKSPVIDHSRDRNFVVKFVVNLVANPIELGAGA
jgi:hypothetical protein